MTTTPGALLQPLQKLVRHLEDDIRQRIGDSDVLTEAVATEFRAAKQAGRTGALREAFRDQWITQAAVAWVLGAVFVRFLEDNGLLDNPIAGGTIAGGTSEAVRYLGGHELALVDLAREQERAYFRAHADHGEREYLEHVFAAVGDLPGMERVFDRRHNPLWRLGPTADGARDLLETFRRRDPQSGAVALTFEASGPAASDLTGPNLDGPNPTGPDLDTRFLGDLYQDLSEAARKRYALLQTPDFVEDFLLDRSLEPAIERWGFAKVRLIDPACGSGHFLLGAFHRLLQRHQTATPADNPRVVAQRALDQIAGVDLNPFAAAIAHFRLLIAALAACRIDPRQPIKRLADAPTFRIQVAAGDALLHGRRRATRSRSGELFDKATLATGAAEHFFAAEDPELLRTIFAQPYHVVVANPPYITVKDPGLRDLYRTRFESCHGQYSLVCPFMERVFDLAIDEGFVSVIVANSFMKRQFGKKLVETVLPQWDLTHVIDTSGAYIPGHGTPTVILFGRARAPLDDDIRAVLSIRGEPSTPEDPRQGKVWRAILEQVDRPGSESEWISVEDAAREQFAKHPWSLQGGGAGAVKDLMEIAGQSRLREHLEAVGRTTHTGCDSAYSSTRETWQRKSLDNNAPLVEGEVVRDWRLVPTLSILLPYDETLEADLSQDSATLRYLWRFKAILKVRREPGGTHEQIGLTWYEWSRFQRERFRRPLGIAFAFVATHNHFVLDRGGKVFKQTAPVIKLPEGASEDDHLGLVGLLNSSTACFWMKQTFFCRGSTVDKRGARQTTVPFEDFWEHDGTKLKQLPIPKARPLNNCQELDRLGEIMLATRASAVCAATRPTRETLSSARTAQGDTRRQMIALQEELDWQCYQLYDLLKHDLTLPKDDVPKIELGERAFEIVLARKVAAGETSTTWFARHGSTPITEIPSHWPAAYRDLVQRRIDAIAEHKAIRLIERPEYKRRWSRQPWEKEEAAALRSWLLDRMEATTLWPEPVLLSCAQLADRLRGDEDFQSVAALYRGRADSDRTKLVTELAVGEAVPNLAEDRYKPSGLRSHEVWRQVWDLQRDEDRIDRRATLGPEHPDHLNEADAKAAKAALDIPVPPKYKSSDFKKSTYWSLRGKLDVPKERFILYVAAERANDPTPMLGWAGWDHQQRAQALASHYIDARDHQAWPDDRLTRLLDGLDELLPWLIQWHNDVDPNLGMGMGSYFQSFVEEERRRLASRL